MKSQVLTLLLLTIGVLLFQSTHQYRLQKREITEYDLTSFIVNTCSADKLDMLIQNLCDQTLESALMGNFPVLTYYCKMIGSENRYCENINRHSLAVDQNTEIKRFSSHRFKRSLNTKDKQPIEETNTNLDLKEKQILALCLVTPEKYSHRFCDPTFEEIRQGQYPQIKRLCQVHRDIHYCRHVLSFSFLEDSLSPSLTTNIHLSSGPSVESISSNPDPLNKNTNILLDV